MTSRAVPRHHALLTAVVSHLESETGKLIGDGEAPDGAIVDDKVTDVYGVVHGLPDESMYGPMDDGQADRVHLVQVTCIGATRLEAQAMADAVREAMINRPITPPSGHAIQLVDEESAGDIDRDDEETPPLFYAPVIFQIYTTPA